MIGIDVVDIARFERRWDNAFMNQLFTKCELAYIERQPRPTRTAAGIFAAKEAFLKALHQPITLKRVQLIEIRHRDDGAPEIVIHEDGFHPFDFGGIHVSISHTDSVAMAMVMITKKWKRQQ
ncbi:holo-acyl-carrier-protein synthase [Sulfobacillus acidophilus TPY]|uniref:Phosphopantetheine-protein transferase n=1 Tax=Sulfobacillus acidophilus (strain ATCC 700253 / DSM 10332 / NAL) TaxID=679936 RepID=G8TZV9_SULAD|nr:holo-acyl-carrier-protein synthase [Sulfobacillus acidophilus TPY]AEW04128.1 phosphopantetheine-protein transferase [Sulfobacillus acidophilus DSM 10332]